MGTIQFKEVNCKNCYKCIRNCPVKAISLRNDHAQVVEDGCILCGKCLQVCPQNAKSVENDLHLVKTYISKHQKVFASIAPSFIPVFNIKNIETINRVFEKLGFSYVEETAIGATVVSKEYKKLIKKHEMKNIISTACPAVVSLIEKHYPQLIPQMAPVVSPMIAHGKMLKEMYGSRIKVVFIGPCLAKKEEFKDKVNDKFIDAVITFDEFGEWLRSEGISLEEETNAALETGQRLNTRFYPAPGGIIKSIDFFSSYRYKPIKFDGIDRCMSVLEELKRGNLSEYFIELNSCTGGCLGGPCMNSVNNSYMEIREKLTNFISNTSRAEHFDSDLDHKMDFSKKFHDKSLTLPVPDEADIYKALVKIGKFTKEQELNCGACGYQTCRDKAIAVINGKAEIYMCLPFMRERAESISNVIIQSTPNSIFALSEDLLIQEANTSARMLFNLTSEDYLGKSIFELVDCGDITEVKNSKNSIINKKYYYEKYNIIVEQSILYINENRMLVIIMKNITKDEKKQIKLHQVQGETIEIAQKVIEKQMRVAQEIASLLGETTAETKVALTKLKNSIEAEMGD